MPSARFSALNGWTWNWISGVSSSSRVLRNPVPRLAAIVIGPLLVNTYLNPITACLTILLVSIFIVESVVLKIGRAWRWSWRFLPTPLISRLTSIP